MSSPSRPEDLIRVHTTPPAERSVVAPERDVDTGLSAPFDRSGKNDGPASHPRRARTTRAESIAPPPRPDTVRPGVAPVPPGRRRLPWRSPAASAGIGAVLVLVLVVVGAGAAALGWFRGGVPAPAGSPAGLSAPSVPDLVPSASNQVTGTSTAGQAALDPQRVFGYRVTFTYTEFEAGSPTQLTRPISVGDSETSLWLCTAGLCRSSSGRSVFPAATPSHSSTRTSTIRAGTTSACDPITNTLDIRREPDGTYSGTSTSIPRAVRAQESTGGGTRICYAVRALGTIRLEPIVMLAPDTPPDTSLPASLDPVRVTGYTGTSTPSGGTASATGALDLACRGGVCLLTCQPLCGPPSVVMATARSWSLSGLQPSALCGTGATTVSLVRAGDGSYTGTATTAYATRVTRPAINCPTSLAISLRPRTR